MGLLSFLQRQSSSPPVPSPADDDVAAARTRARRRLMGAAVLVLVGVIGFPLVFETQPRPIPVDIPIEIPRKENAPVLALPPARKVEQAASTPAAAPREPETAGDAARNAAPTPSAPAAPVIASPAPAAPEASKKPAAESRPPAAPAVAEAARARALLEGKDVAAAPKPDASGDGARFVVQVGAFADAAAARETRSKVEKLGLKSYTQVVETASGSRIRVRAGPFGSRDEADKALAKAKAAGLNAVVLTL
ncbi:MAG: SPOR domain-containing protein [Piscinibacter sp.]|nr:SPOR domain-containing protein [Piscinibacter sp.]